MSIGLAWREVGAIAAKEFRERRRNRWIVAVAAVFAAFALLIAYFGAAQQGAVGFRGIQVTIASLSSSLVAQLRRLRTLFCSKLKNDSIAALSPAAPTLPIDPTMSCWSSARRNFLLRNCDPLSVLTRTRVNSDYAEVLVKPRNIVRARGSTDVRIFLGLTLGVNGDYKAR